MFPSDSVEALGKAYGFNTQADNTTKAGDVCFDGDSAGPEEVGHDAYLRHSHMTLVCNYAATCSKECHLRV